MHDTRQTTDDTRVVSIPQWLPGPEAADALGVSLRTLQRLAARGDVERRQDGRASSYRVTRATTRATDSRQTTRHAPPIDDTRHARHEPAPPVNGALEALGVELATVRAELVSAERRAAVAEYRAAIADDGAEQIEALRVQLDQVTAERDEARDLARTYGAALRRRHATVQRLLLRLRGA